MKKIPFITAVLVLVLINTQAFCANTDHDPKENDGPGVWNISRFGARNDGKTLNTQSIQNAIDACAQAGGGVVFVPAGTFISGPLFLRSNVELYLTRGAVLKGSPNLNDYPPVDIDLQGFAGKRYASLITGIGLKNVSVTGDGIIDGNGDVWMKAVEVSREISARKKNNQSLDGLPGVSPLKYGRPRIINLFDCQNVLIRGVTLQNSPAWTLHPVMCDHVIIERVTVLNPYESYNSDGINPTSCNDVLITGCFVDTGDDGITLKSGSDWKNSHLLKPCENIVISDCIVKHAHGGVVVGTEIAGHIRNVTISNCVFDGTRSGIRLKTVPGMTSVIENFRASNIVMRRTEVALGIRIISERWKQNPEFDYNATFRNIHFSNITATRSRCAMMIDCIPEMQVENLWLNDLFIEADKGMDIQWGSQIYMSNVVVDAPGPALVAKNITDMEIRRFCDPNPTEHIPVIQLENITDAWIHSNKPASGTDVFIEMVGHSNKSVVCSDNVIPAGTIEKVITNQPATNWSMGWIYPWTLTSVVTRKEAFKNTPNLYLPVPPIVRETIDTVLDQDAIDEITSILRIEENGMDIYKIDTRRNNKPCKLEISENGKFYEK